MSGIGYFVDEFHVALPLTFRLDDKFVFDRDGCWRWTSGKFRGYGSLWLNGKRVRAHRAMYELLVGPIPDGLQIDHLCRNRECVNPDHLEPVTAREHAQRSSQALKTECEKGHLLAGENLHVNSKGHRRCRTCVRETKNRSRAAKREAMQPTGRAD